MRLPALLACALGAALLPAADLLETNRDPAVAPTADFWRHANARWNAAHPLAADRASYYSYDWLEDLVRADVLALHRDLPTDDPYYIKLWAEIDALRERQLKLSKVAA